MAQGRTRQATEGTMHTITLKQDVVRPDDTLLKAGQYLVDDLNAAELMVEAERGTATVHHFSPLNAPQILRGLPLNASEATSLGAKLDTRLRPDQILVIHPGGYGDQMMLGPALRAHKRQFPGAEVTVCCREKHRVVFEGLGYPDRFVDYPLDLSAAACQYDACHFTENMNEASGDGRTMHAVDSKAKILGVDLKGDTKVEYKVTEFEALCAAEAYPPMYYNGRAEKVVRPRIAIQVSASAYNRTYSHQKLAVIFGKLYDAEWEIFILGTEGSTDQSPVPEKARDRVHDLAHERLTFRQSAAVVAGCNVVLAPDSAMMHVAGALGVPCVALFGPIDWEVRSKYYPSVRAIQGFKKMDGTIACPMQPCFFHQRGGLYFPKDGPCATTGRCESIDSINPLVVLDWVGKVMRK